MKVNENKKTVVRVTEGNPAATDDVLQDSTQDKIQKLKKPLIFGLMGIVFLGCMYLIFKPSSEKKEIEAKIIRKLKYYNLGKFDLEKVEYLRTIKNDLFSEISKSTKSKYFKNSKGLANMTDFNLEKLLKEYSLKYEKIEKEDLSTMINYSIYLYYMR